MPLDPLQERIVRVAAALPEARTLALAGGGAMIVHGFVARKTRDVDLFTEADDRGARPRDFYDVHALLQQYPRERLLELAGAKDRGFTASTFIDALTAINRLSGADWAEDGIEPSLVQQIRTTFVRWRNELTNQDGG
jgi:hypothetical protein